MSYIRLVLWFVGKALLAILFIIGLAGIPDDLANWNRWLAAIDSANLIGGRGVLAFAALAFLIGPWLVRRYWPAQGEVPAASQSIVDSPGAKQIAGDVQDESVTAENEGIAISTGDRSPVTVIIQPSGPLPEKPVPEAASPGVITVRQQGRMVIAGLPVSSDDREGVYLVLTEMLITNSSPDRTAVLFFELILPGEGKDQVVGAEVNPPKFDSGQEGSLHGDFLGRSIDLGPENSAFGYVAFFMTPTTYERITRESIQGAVSNSKILQTVKEVMRFRVANQIGGSVDEFTLLELVEGKAVEP